MAETLAPSIYDISLRPLRFFMYLLGILPCECGQPVTAPPNRIQTLKHKLWKSLHMLAILFFIMLVSMQRYKRSLGIVYDVDDVISGAMDFIGFSTLVLVNFIAQVESTWKSQHYRLIFRRFERMRAQFRQQLNITVDCTMIRYYSVLLYIYFWIYWIIMIFITLLLRLDTNIAPRLLLTYYSEVVLKLKLIEYLLFIAIVFVMLSTLCAAGEEFVRDLQLTRFDAWLGPRRVCLSRIFVLQDLHSLLWANVRQIETYWEWCMPGLMLKIYLDCTLMAYWIYLSFQCETSTFIKIYCIGVMIIQWLTFVLTCFISSRCEKLDKKFRTIFHGISTDRRNIYLSSCLRQMSLQLMHEPIYFTAGGFVDINKNTLGRFVFSVITYMVILVQFRMSV